MGSKVRAGAKWRLGPPVIKRKRSTNKSCIYKTQYATKEKALQALKVSRGLDEVRLCHWCDHWHLFGKEGKFK